MKPTLALAALALALSGGLAAASDGLPRSEPEAGGEHLRIETPSGPIHLWRPGDFQEAGAGIVLYVHGYRASIDEAWADHGLARQFALSRENALFLAPAAPVSPRDPVRFPSLDSVLLAAEQAGVALPSGPLVVVGHSGAVRTILGWLPDRRVRHLILLDALYGPEAPFHAWLRAGGSRSGRQLVLVGARTARKAERFARRYRNAPRRPAIPEDASRFTPGERSAPLLYLRSQYEHMQIVLSGRVIPLLLQLMPLPPLGSLAR